MPDSAAIEAEGLRKSYGDVEALNGIDLRVPAGTVLGLLGPNGAGKTTAVRILTTLLPPDGGSARVAGLDPRSRIDLWETIEGRVADGTTVLLTTQYLDEADALADRISVIDHGRVIAEGSSDELKDQVGGERIDVTLESHDDAETAIAALAPVAAERPAMSDGVLAMPVRERKGAIAEAVRRLNEVGVGIDDIALRRPTLDDVFLALTGHATESDGDRDEFRPDGGQNSSQEEAR